MVMVVDSFIALYGREPTPTEIGKMMEIKANIDKQRNKLMGPNKYNPEMKSPKRTVGRPKRQPRLTRLSMECKKINRMVKLGMGIDKIAYVLGIKMSEVECQINKHKMPRNDTK